MIFEVIEEEEEEVEVYISDQVSREAKVEEPGRVGGTARWAVKGPELFEAMWSKKMIECWKVLMAISIGLSGWTFGRAA